MRFSIRDVGRNGLKIQESCDPAVLDLSGDEFRCLTPVDVQAKVKRVEDECLLVKVRTSARFGFQCARCLKDLEKDIAGEFLFDLEIDKTTEYIDLTEDIRQEIILSFPPVVLCSEKCRGLCPDCGANLNNESCTCKPTNQSKVVSSKE